MPAYNAAQTLEKTILESPLELVDEIVFVDDASKDNTLEVVQSFLEKNKNIFIFDLKNNSFSSKEKKILFHVISHKKNLGYGGNQKTCYDFALKRGAGIVIMLHPDYQYDPRCVKYFIELLNDHIFDVVLGSRIRNKKDAISNGMPIYKYFSNRFLTFIQNITTGYSLSEWHTGMRGYTREVLQHVDYQKFSNDFIFDTQMLFAIVKKRCRIGEVSVPVRYFKDSSSINLKRSLLYGFLTILETIKFVFQKK